MDYGSAICGGRGKINQYHCIGLVSDLSIRKLKNFPVDSNCYIISHASSDQCIIVDPYQRDETAFQLLFENAKLVPVYIILTHEHFDHIGSVEYLRTKYNCKVIASTACSQNIVDSKKNLSLFYDQKGFYCLPADILINHEETIIQWNNISIKFFVTPGHSAGSICFLLFGHLFTGDTIMEAAKMVFKLPGSSKNEWVKSVQKIKKLNLKATVHPGHGDDFKLQEWEHVHLN